VIISTPSHGLKNGNIAIDANKVERIKFIGVIANIYNKNTDSKKCSITIKNVACIKFVIDVINYCLFYENIVLIVLLL
jgi:hypothetical protein